MPVCRFFETPRGCRNGDTCAFFHASNDDERRLIEQIDSINIHDDRQLFDFLNSLPDGSNFYYFNGADPNYNPDEDTDSDWVDEEDEEVEDPEESESEDETAGIKLEANWYGNYLDGQASVYYDHGYSAEFADFDSCGLSQDDLVVKAKKLIGPSGLKPSVDTLVKMATSYKRSHV
jgi:hypothetical protein